MSIKPSKIKQTAKALPKAALPFKEAYKRLYTEYKLAIKNGTWNWQWLGSNEITGLPAKIVWLYLRENIEYQGWYKVFSTHRDDYNQSNDDVTAFKASFGLKSLPLEPKSCDWPDDIVFSTPEASILSRNGIVKKNRIQKEIARLKTVQRIAAESIFNNQTLIVPPFSNPDLVLQQLQILNLNFFERQGINQSKSLMVNSNLKELVENIFLKYCYQSNSLSPTATIATCREVGIACDSLSSHQIKQRVKTTEKIIRASPWIFFTGSRRPTKGSKAVK